MSRGEPRVPPQGLLIDIGLTLIHPDGGVLLEELRRGMPGVRIGEDDLVAALQLAAEARHLRFPAGDGDARVAATWAMFLDLPIDLARPAWMRAVARPDLYVHLDPGADALLTGLRARGIRIAATSNSDGTLEAELARFGLREAFDAVVDSTAIGSEKPDRGIYREACGSLGLPASACWFLGDGFVNDVIGPQGAGVALGVLYDRFDLYPHLSGVARIRRLNELLDLIDDGRGAVADRVPSAVGHGNA